MNTCTLSENGVLYNVHVAAHYTSLLTHTFQRPHLKLFKSLFRFKAPADFSSRGYKLVLGPLSGDNTPIVPSSSHPSPRLEQSTNHFCVVRICSMHVRKWLLFFAYVIA